MVEGCTVKIDRKRDGVAGGGSEHRIRILCETVKKCITNSTVQPAASLSRSVGQKKKYYLAMGEGCGRHGMLRKIIVIRALHDSGI
jgi:hypothetical protein